MVVVRLLDASSLLFAALGYSCKRLYSDSPKLSLILTKRVGESFVQELLKRKCHPITAAQAEDLLQQISGSDLLDDLQAILNAARNFKLPKNFKHRCNFKLCSDDSCKFPGISGFKHGQTTWNNERNAVFSCEDVVYHAYHYTSLSQHPMPIVHAVRMIIDAADSEMVIDNAKIEELIARRGELRQAEIRMAISELEREASRGQRKHSRTVFIFLEPN
jgi:hypothetical protein